MPATPLSPCRAGRGLGWRNGSNWGKNGNCWVKPGLVKADRSESVRAGVYSQRFGVWQKQFFQILPQRAVGRPASTRPGDDDKLQAGWKTAQVQTKVFPNDAFYAVASHGVAHFAADRKADFCILLPLSTGKEQKTGADRLAARGGHLAKFFRNPETRGLGKMRARRPRCHKTTCPQALAFPPLQTAKRRRLLARRRDRMARPFRVAMRALKPWVCLRRIVLG